MYADGNMLKIKHDVLYEVAKLAFAGELEEKRDNIAMELIPGPTPQFRCCIYKEREIIRQRVRLAEGKAPGTKDDGNVIQVIPTACEDCPISSYVVTDNCMNCIGKATPAISGLLRLDATVPTSTLPSARSAESALRHVLTMPSRP